MGNGDLLHFTKRDIAMEKILPAKQLRFSSLLNSHDPYEYKRRIISATNSDKFNDIVSNDSRLLSFTKAIPLDSGLSRSRMWSQFASSHTGVCLVFSRDSIVEYLEDKFSQYFYQFNEINYSLLPSFKHLSYTRNNADITGKEFEFVKDNVLDIFFRKNPDYQNEDEVRLLILDQSRSLEYFDITRSLTAIILGDACHKSYHKYFLEYAKENNIVTRKVNYRNGELIITRPSEDYSYYLPF